MKSSACDHPCHTAYVPLRESRREFSYSASPVSNRRRRNRFFTWISPSRGKNLGMLGIGQTHLSKYALGPERAHCGDSAEAQNLLRKTNGLDFDGRRATLPNCLGCGFLAPF